MKCNLSCSKLHFGSWNVSRRHNTKHHTDIIINALFTFSSSLKNQDSAKIILPSFLHIELNMALINIFVLFTWKLFESAVASEASTVPQDFPKSRGYNYLNHKIISTSTTRLLLQRYPNCNVSHLSYIGDGQCDKIDSYNTAACGWDGGDCCEETCVGSCPSERMQCRDPKVTFYPNCTMLLVNIGDGYCDTKNGENTPECGWDGGDCCQASCKPGLWYACNATTFHCLDPKYMSVPSKPITIKANPMKPIPALPTPVLKRAPTTAVLVNSSKPAVNNNWAPAKPPMPNPRPTTLKPLPRTPTASVATKIPSFSQPATSSPTAACTYKLHTMTNLTPFHLFLSLPKGSNISYLDDTHIVEFTNITNKYLNNYLIKSSNLGGDGIEFQSVTLNLPNTSNTTVEEQSLLWKPVYNGVAYFSIAALCNVTNSTVPQEQKNLLTGLISSAFVGDQKAKFNSALQESGNSLISQMTLNPGYESLNTVVIQNYFNNVPLPEDRSKAAISVLLVVGVFCLVGVTAAVFFPRRRHTVQSNIDGRRYRTGYQ